MMKVSFLNKIFGTNDIKTFKGGIHPKDMKSTTESKAILDITPPKTLVFPLSQHIGAMAKPIVEVGDTVLAGQKIAEADGFVSSNVHSSVSGKVVAIEPRLHPNGSRIEAIVIENDGLDTQCEDMKKYTFDEATPAQIVAAVKEAGIVGMGGAAFPTHVKFSPPEGKKIEYVIINGAECEPYLTSDHRAMLEAAKEIIDGLKLTLKVFGLKEGYIAIETNKPDAIRHMSYCAAKETEYSIKIVAVKTKYPQGSEKHLIKAVTGISVPGGKLPVDVGVLVNNIDSCAAVARAVLKSQPLIRRIVTVSGDAIVEPKNLRVPVGTSFEYLVESCGGFAKEAAKLIMGGPMMGMALNSLDVPVIKGSSGLLAFSEDLVQERVQKNCIRCGRCVSGCPMNLMPFMLKEAVCANDLERLVRLNIMDCLQCGSCTYVCPAEQNPLRYIRNGKTKLREAKK